jgi:exopolyphosphatase/guanosine-5'-triphosphate,3'-diphosphate pyrophosphatase
MLRASIDLGTNTCLLLLAEVGSGQVTKVLGDFVRIIRLGEGVDLNKCLQPEAMKRTISCLSEYKDIICNVGLSPEEAVCVATSQARDAKNGKEFLARIETMIGFRFLILSGKEEAYYTFHGSLLPGMDASCYTVVDLGGGSTEFVAERSGHSVDLGSVRFTERYLKSDPVTEDEFRCCQEKIDSELEGLKKWRDSFPDDLRMLTVAGTATTLASWRLKQNVFNANEIEKVQLTRKDLHWMVEELKCQTVAERREQVGIEPERADVLLAGAMILWRIMEKLNFSNCRVSSRGLRYGILLHNK